MTNSPEGEQAPHSPVVISVDPLRNAFNFLITTQVDTPAAYQGHNIVGGSGPVPAGSFPEMVDYAVRATRDAYRQFDSGIRRLMKN